MDQSVVSLYIDKQPTLEQVRLQETKLYRFAGNVYLTMYGSMLHLL